MESIAALDEARRRKLQAQLPIRDASALHTELTCEPAELVELCNRLVHELGYSFAGLVVEQQLAEWELRYLFYGERDAGWVHVLLRRPLSEEIFPSITPHIHAADWHEREAEDLFELSFTGHPRLGDFVLHNDAWQEGIAPMRKAFDATRPYPHREPDANWRPRRVVQAPGAFVMPIGPVFSDVTESAHFLLETVGEDVIRTLPRLFYKYRAVEKIAEGKRVEDALLLAERFAAITAFAHGLAFCLAAENICTVEVPARARVLRVLLAELERLRHHAGAIADICESTALTVAANQAAIFEEELLRLSGAFTGHRYLFGLIAPGGLTRDFESDACHAMTAQAKAIGCKLDELERMLQTSSSFLDRLEEVGIITLSEATAFGLVGPIARASGLARDLRAAQPYAAYREFVFDVPRENEGDGYARLRILFSETRQSLRIIEQAAAALPDGAIRTPKFKLAEGAALGWVEAPRGAALHWLHLGADGQIERLRIITPSFTNWHGFHLAAENFAFQDFPIILASFGLSAGENDR